MTRIREEEDSPPLLFDSDKGELPTYCNR